MLEDEKIIECEEMGIEFSKKTGKVKSLYFILNLCAKFSLKSQPSIYGKYGKRIL